MTEPKLNKSMILHALKMNKSLNQTAIFLGVGRATLWRALKRFKIDPKPILKQVETPAETIPKIAVNRTGKRSERTSTLSSYSGPHLGDYSPYRR